MRKASRAAMAILLAASNAAFAQGTPAFDALASPFPAKGPECRTYILPELQYPTDTVPQSVWAQICYRGHLSAEMPVQVLIHGGAYNHTYWDSPFEPERYSYVYAA